MGEALGGAPLGVVVSDDLEAALAARPDALIDYTHPSVIRQHLAWAFAHRVPVVIGTTGLADADFEQIDAAARAAGVGCATGNFAITAALLQHFARFAAQHVPHWEIVEYNKATKPDVPSGTARELAELLGRVREPEHGLPDDELIGPIEARGAEFGGARVHSLRLPGYASAVEVHFGLPGERLVMRHDADIDGAHLRARLAARGAADPGHHGPRARAGHAAVRLALPALRERDAAQHQRAGDAERRAPRLVEYTTAAISDSGVIG